MATEKKSLEKFMASVNASRSTVYCYITEFFDELADCGCIEVRQTAKTRRIYILNEDCVLQVFARHGVKFNKKKKQKKKHIENRSDNLTDVLTDTSKEFSFFAFIVSRQEELRKEIMEASEE